MKRRTAFRLLGLSAVFVAPLAMSHIALVMRGVHFNAGKVDFGVPPRKFGYSFNETFMGEDSPRPGTRYWTSESWPDYDRAQWRESVARKTFQKARQQEANGDLKGAMATYRDRLRRGLGGVAEDRERIELLSQVTPTTEGLDLVLKSVGSKTTGSLPSPEQVAPVLRPFVAYHAADQLAAKDARGGANAFLRVAKDYPSSSRAEPSLIMAARTVLNTEAKNPELVDLRLAYTALTELLREHPQTRFRLNALGWLARIDFLQGRLDEAEAKYRQQYALSKTEAERFRALDSLAICATRRGRRDLAAIAYLRKFATTTRHPYEFKRALAGRLDSFNGTDARRFSDAIRHDSSLLIGYLDYRTQFTDLTPTVLTYGSAISGLPAADRPRVAVRLAQAAIQLGRDRDARRFVAQARDRGLKGDEAAMAEYIHGTLELRAGRRENALAAFRTIRSRYGKSYLANGAKENLAILAERSGRLGDALDLYDELGYRMDFAYMADARMSPGELQSYLRRPNARRRDVLTYTLGMRYLRLNRWSEAEATFAKLSPARRKELTASPGWNWDQNRGLQDPLATLAALRKMDEAVKRAKGREAKADALYRMASYYYTHRPLLLYSPMLWRGDRAISISYSWNDRAATAADRLALARHHNEHECLSHALALCRRVVREYPGTVAAGPAAYRGAVAAQRLANMSPYWRWVDYQKDLRGEAVALMKKAVDDPKLKRAAIKYKGVFREERMEARKDSRYDSSLPKRQWAPGQEE